LCAGGHLLGGVLEQLHRDVGGLGVAGEQGPAHAELHTAFEVDAVYLDQPGPDGRGQPEEQRPDQGRLS
jgi:hypothetical protein